MTSARWDRIALVAIGVGVAVRVVWVLGLHPPLEFVHSDMKTYVDLAVKLAKGGALERYDAFYPPGTHLLLAVPLFIFGTDRTGLWACAVLWCALSAFTPYAMWRFAKHHLTAPAAALTAVFVALWPLHISYAGYFTSETPALALLVSSLWLSARAAARGGGGAFQAGLLGGAAIANRPALALNVLVAIASTAKASAVRRTAVFVAGVGVVLALVALHNTVAVGRPTLISENGGLVFFIGHCDALVVRTGDPVAGPYFEYISPPALERGSGRTFVMQTPLAWDQGDMYRMGLDCIRNDGIAHLRTLARGVFDMTLTTKPWPQVEEPVHGDRIALVNTIFSAALPFILVAAVGLIRERRRRREPVGEMIMLAHFASVLVTAVVFYGDPRYRTVYDGFALALLAAVLADRLFDRRAPIPEVSREVPVQDPPAETVPRS